MKVEERYGDLLRSFAKLDEDTQRRISMNLVDVMNDATRKQD